MTDSRDHAMIVAQYTDCRAYRGLGVVRITCELPVEYEADVHRLIGYPAKDRALILSVANPEQVKTFGAPPKPSPAPEKKRERVPFDELKPSQQAGILCKDAEFWEFLQIDNASDAKAAEAIAARKVHNICRVDSRTKLDQFSDARVRWETLMDSYRDWQRTDNRYSGTPAYEASR